jgi:hypothetical protein
MRLGYNLMALMCFLLSTSQGVDAQSYRSTPNFQPRVVQPPRPSFSREQYQLVGLLSEVLLASGSEDPTEVESEGQLEGIMGGVTYDHQTATRYYYPRYLGVQTTTPYMIRPGPY